MSNQHYLCIQRSPSGPCEPPSPSQMEQMYAKFMSWQEKFKDNIVDMGGRLAPEGKVVTHDSVSDGPFVETKEIVGGYMIIRASSMEEAMCVAQESPGVGMSGGSIEVRPISSP